MCINLEIIFFKYCKCWKMNIDKWISYSYVWILYELEVCFGMISNRIYWYYWFRFLEDVCFCI